VLNTGINFYQWDPERVYSFRLEWDAFPAIVSSQRVQVLMDEHDHGPQLRQSLPSHTHWVELGMAPRAESLEQATYSNVRIGVRQP
jgi:hypothetical protein